MPTTGTDPNPFIDYIGPMQFNGNVLHNIGNEEGRSRPVVSASGALSFTYDYFIKDHLENVRTVVAVNTEGITTTVLGSAGLTATESGSGPGPVGGGIGATAWQGAAVVGDATARAYTATHEFLAGTMEESVFSGLAKLRDDKPGSIDQADQKAAKLDGNDAEKRIGDAIMIRVMPGDKFSVSAQSYYEEGIDSVVGSGQDIVSSLITAFAGGITGGVNSGTENAPITMLWQNAFTDPNLVNMYSSLTSGNGYDALKPAAFLNYIVYDDQMNIIAEKCKSIQISGDAGTWSTVASDGDISIDEAGYVMSYISSLARKTVHMDAVSMIFYRGHVLEENHYYPFGLNIETSSSYANEINNYKFTTKELQRNEFYKPSGGQASLGWEDYGARMYDPQIGRWNGVDDLAEDNYHESPYIYGANNPVRNIDIDGKSALDYTKGYVYAIVDNFIPGLNISNRYSTTSSSAYRDYQEGQTQGNLSSIVASIMEVGSGGSMGTLGAATTVGTGGAAAPVSIPLVAVGTGMVIHGAWAGSNAILNMSGKPKGSLVPNPDGSKGKSDHQEKVKELTGKAQSEANSGERVLTEKKIQNQPSTRIPDVQILDEHGKTRKVLEGERRPNSQRNIKREAEYKRLGIEQETHKVGK